MIHDVDESLRQMIQSEVTNGGGIDISFDAPNKDWSSRRSVPSINVFLYDIREDVGRRDLGPQEIRDERGYVVARRPPPRRFKLSYLLTAWTQRAEDEHRLLSALLSLFLRHDAVPPEHLAGSLADTGVPTLFSLALPPGPDRSLSDIWSALGGELKPSLDLQVITPVDPARFFEVGPPTLEAPRIRLGPGGASRNGRPAGNEPGTDGGGGSAGARGGDRSDGGSGGTGPGGADDAGRSGPGAPRRRKRKGSPEPPPPGTDRDGEPGGERDVDDVDAVASGGRDGAAGSAGDADEEVVRRAPAVDVEGEPGAERIQVGTDEAPGRTFTIRTKGRP